MSKRLDTTATEGPTPTFTLRLPAELADAVEAVRAQHEAAHGGGVSRADAVRLLLTEALAARARRGRRSRA